MLHGEADVGYRRVGVVEVIVRRIERWQQPKPGDRSSNSMNYPNTVAKGTTTLRQGPQHGATTRTTLSRTNAWYMHEFQHTVATTRRHGASTSSHGNKSANATLTGASKRRNTRFPPRIPDTPHPPHTPPASVGEGAVEGKAGPLSHVAPRLVTAASRCDRGDDREGTDSGRVKCAYQAVPLPLLAATATLPRLPKGTLVALEARQRGSSNATLRQCRGTGAPRQGSCRRG